MFYLQYSKFFSDKFNREISKKELLEKSGISGSILNQLVEKKIFQIHNKEVGRLGLNEKIETQNVFKLSDVQNSAFKEIVRQFEEKQTVLLHGVTSSGKTEIKKKYIKPTLNQAIVSNCFCFIYLSLYLCLSLLHLCTH